MWMLKQKDCFFVVVISNSGKVIGKSRKNHIPRVGDFNEVIACNSSVCIAKLKGLNLQIQNEGEIKQSKEIGKTNQKELTSHIFFDLMSTLINLASF